mgnify:CR=1 FL=1
MAFQLKDLTTYSWLLDAIRNMTHGLANAPVFSNVIKQFEMMNVQRHNDIAQDCRMGKRLRLRKPRGFAPSDATAGINYFWFKLFLTSAGGLPRWEVFLVRVAAISSITF